MKLCLRHDLWHQLVYVTQQKAFQTPASPLHWFFNRILFCCIIFFKYWQKHCENCCNLVISLQQKDKNKDVFIFSIIKKKKLIKALIYCLDWGCSRNTFPTASHVWKCLFNWCCAADGSCYWSLVQHFNSFSKTHSSSSYNKSWPLLTSTHTHE